MFFFVSFCCSGWLAYGSGRQEENQLGWYSCDPKDIRSDKIQKQKIIDEMVKCMRMAPCVGLATPQIGNPLRVGFSLFIFVRKFGDC
jgi:hypothetical protein